MSNYFSRVDDEPCWCNCCLYGCCYGCCGKCIGDWHSDSKKICATVFGVCIIILVVFTWYIWFALLLICAILLLLSGCYGCFCCCKLFNDSYFRTLHFLNCCCCLFKNRAFDISCCGCWCCCPKTECTKKERYEMSSYADGSATITIGGVPLRIARQNQTLDV